MQVFLTHAFLTVAFTFQPPSPASLGEVARSAEVVTKLASELERSYVFEDKGIAMAAALKTKSASGAWDALEGDALAEALTATCRSVANDLHLRVRHEKEGATQPQNPFFLDEGAARREWLRRNYGFERAERLRGNVGYLEIREFVPSELSRSTAAAAMAFLQDTDALIIDLRKNGGGDPEAVRFLCSYFFGDAPVLLNRLVNREMGTVEEFWTLKELPGKRYVDKPVFVLVSNKTFSAAEEFTYNLQSLGRATIVGKTTGGGAHPVDKRKLTHGYSVAMPVARAENPVTKTNWEAVGVKPEVDAEDDVCLDRAWSLAFEQLAANETDPERKRDLLQLAAEKGPTSGR